MYQDIINLINTYITANGVGSITGARLNQVLTALANYYGFDSVTVATLPAGSQATATVTNRTLNLGIPSGQDGRDGVDATNPFKGWWMDFDDLKAAYTATEGDSAYVYNGVGWDIYIYDSTASSDNYWADSGTDADTTADKTFQTGEELNLTPIDDTHLDNPASGALALAEDVMQLKAKLEGVTREETKATWEEYKVNNVGGFYKEESGTISWVSSSNGNYRSAVINLVGYDSARFLGTLKITAQTPPPVYIFVQMDSSDNIIYYEHYKADVSAPITLAEYETKKVSGATKLVVLLKAGATAQLQPTNFYCYLSKGESAASKEFKRETKKIDLSLYNTITRYIKSSSHLWSSLSTSFSTLAVPVKEGDVVKITIGSIDNTQSNPSTDCFLLKDEVVATDSAALMADGFLPIKLTANSQNIIEVPKGCTNIAVCVKYYTYTPVEVLSMVIESVKEEQQEVHLVSIGEKKEETGSYREDGTFNSGSTSKTVFFEVDDSKKYCVNTRVGYIADSDPSQNPAYITYLANDMTTVLGCDDEILGRGYVYFPIHHKLTLPSGTKYIAMLKAVTGQFGLFEETEEAAVDSINYVETLVNEPNYIILDDSVEHTPTQHLSAWAFRLPQSYDEQGTPTHVIAMLHGATGYVTPNILGYPNSGGTGTLASWKDWQDKYLANGFAVFDINGFGIYATDNDSARHEGNPMAIETMKKAFEYLKQHYNIAAKMFIHGSSMGGVLAQNYIRMYPEDVMNVALFAPACAAYSVTISTYPNIKDAYVAAWGYENATEMVSDNYSHFYNFNPLFNCLKIKKEDGSVALNKVSVEMMQDFIKDTDGLSGESDYQYIEKSIVPIKIWIGSSDTTVPSSMATAVYNAYYNGGTNIKLRIINGAAHSFCVGDNNTFVADEAIGFFKESL